MNQPWLALVLNIILPGLGYLYNRQRMLLGVGLAAFFGFIYFTIATSGPSSSAQTHSPTYSLISLLAVLLFYICLALDAYQEAVAAKKAKPPAFQ